MRRSHRPLILAARRSRLARLQAETIGRELLRVNPGLQIEYHWIESEGDQAADVALADAGGKGLFARAIEKALREEKADLAVHSLKDLPAGGSDEGAGLVIAAVPVRADARDCLISRDGWTALEQLPPGAKIGTASPRRAGQILCLRPDVKIDLIRGNVETRLRKVLEDKLYDATLLALAGLQRAGLEEHAKHPLDFNVMLPAACQGALAVQCRANDHLTLIRCLPLNDTLSAAAAHAERQVVAGLAGDCHSPIAVYAQPVPYVPAPKAGAAIVQSPVSRVQSLEEGASSPRDARPETRDAASGSDPRDAQPETRDALSARRRPPRPIKDTTALYIRARVLSPDGAACIEGEATAAVRFAGKAVKQLLTDLRARGAAEVLGKKK